MDFGALPWEHGPLAFILGAGDDPIGVPGLQNLLNEHVPLPPLPEVVASAAAAPVPAESPASEAREVAQPRGRRTAGRGPVAQDAIRTQAAVDKWQLVLTAAGPHSSLGKLADGDELILRTAVEQCLELKSAATSSKRAGAFLLFMRWSQDEGRQAFPIDEAVVNAYLEVASGASATRASSFLEALAFAFGMFQLCDLDTVLTPRNRGLAARGVKRKRIRVQRLPLSAAAVQVCEAEIATGLCHTSLSPQEYILLGFFLFRLHARLRCGDASRIDQEPVIIEEFFEAKLEPGQHKTGHAKAFRDLANPVAGFAQGVSQVPWCQKWLEARAQLGLKAEDDGTLQPAAHASGDFGVSRIDTSEVGRWDRSILAKMGITEAASEQFGNHTAKATLLSWAAKADLAPQHRKLLGAHVDRDDKSMITYARDAMAGPLARLKVVLEAIRERRFNPDASRSGRWVEAPFPPRSSKALMPSLMNKMGARCRWHQSNRSQRTRVRPRTMGLAQLAVRRMGPSKGHLVPRTRFSARLAGAKNPGI